MQVIKCIYINISNKLNEKFISDWLTGLSLCALASVEKSYSHAKKLGHTIKFQSLLRNISIYVDIVKLYL